MSTWTSFSSNCLNSLVTYKFLLKNQKSISKTLNVSYFYSCFSLLFQFNVLRDTECAGELSWIACNSAGVTGDPVQWSVSPIPLQLLAESRFQIDASYDASLFINALRYVQEVSDQDCKSFRCMASKVVEVSGIHSDPPSRGRDACYYLIGQWVSVLNWHKPSQSIFSLAASTLSWYMHLICITLMRSLRILSMLSLGLDLFDGWRYTSILKCLISFLFKFKFLYKQACDFHITTMCSNISVELHIC